jgi:L-lactate dehydrogenase complex protein LldE
MTTADPRTVALFVTCLADLMRPEIGFAAAELIERAGFVVAVPRQGCCGQPNYNAGDRVGARAIAKAAIAALEPFAVIVVPSGSCGGMIAKHYPTLFEPTDPWAARAISVAGRTMELTQFLHAHPPAEVPRSALGKAFYHDSCSALREMKIHDGPRALLKTHADVELTTIPEPEVCCGFGGLFCVKYPEIADRMAQDKCEAIVASGAETLISGDLGCLLNIGGRLARMGSPIRTLHIAEALAGAS